MILALKKRFVHNAILQKILALVKSGDWKENENLNATVKPEVFFFFL